MGEYAGFLPRKNFSFHCLENESNERNIKNTEGIRDTPVFTQASESQTATVAETKTSPTKSLAVFQIKTAREPNARRSEQTVVKSASIARQECLLSSSDKRSGRLEKLPNKLDALSGEGLERIVVVPFFCLI